MRREQFKTLIDAPKEKVWTILWGDETYPEWTSPFSEESKAETDWKQGSKVLFLNGNNEGMVSEITEKRPNEYMAFKHIGLVKDGVEQLDGEEVSKWAGSMETYELQPTNGKTELIISMDIEDQYRDYFKEIWPKALEKLKILSESEKD